MPCYKCSNGKYKYGERGNCQFDTLGACQAAERAIHGRENKGDAMAATKPWDKEPKEEPKKPKKKPMK